MLTAIRSDGIAVSSVQKTTDIHPTTTQYLMDKMLSDGLHVLRATEVVALQNRCTALEAVATALEARCTALEAALPTFKFNGGTPVPLKQLQLRTGDFPGTAYYPQSGILMASITTPPLQSPY